MYEPIGRMPRDCYREPIEDPRLIRPITPPLQRYAVDGIQSSVPDPMELESFREPLFNTPALIALRNDLRRMMRR